MKPDKIPKSALSLYVKLYCKRKGGTSTKYYNNLIEATKSWLSLNEEEKQQFSDKLQECRVKFKHRFADYLKNVEPYLKKKPTTKIAKQNFHEIIAPDTSCQPIETGNQTDGTNAISYNLFLDENVNETVAEIDKSCWMETFMENEAPECHETETTEVEPTSNPLPEPLPPSVKSAKELFNITKAMVNQNEKVWETLKSLEKQRYRNAVLKLKKDYIFKYKAYLESLPSVQLFDYYNKITES